jgi:hypothetical protein
MTRSGQQAGQRLACRSHGSWPADSPISHGKKIVHLLGGNAWLLRRAARYYPHRNTPTKDHEMNHASIALPATRNEAWGFWGAMDDRAQAAWLLAMTAVADATGADFETVRAFLDSKHGRHFAGDLQDPLHAGQSLEEAIGMATRKWMGWTIGRLTSKDYGIPRGLPYLTGFVIHCGIFDEEFVA